MMAQQSETAANASVVRTNVQCSGSASKPGFMWASLFVFLNQAKTFYDLTRGPGGGRGHREGTNASMTLILHMSRRKSQSA